jgi:hypothetical protein
MNLLYTATDLLYTFRTYGHVVGAEERVVLLRCNVVE